MGLVDVLVVIWVALFALQGAYRGLVVQALSLVGTPKAGSLSAMSSVDSSGSTSTSAIGYGSPQSASTLTRAEL